MSRFSEEKKNYLNSDDSELHSSLGLPKKKMKTNMKDSALLPGWNVLVESASRIKGTEEDDSMVQLGGFVGDDETDDLEHKSLLGFNKADKKAVVGLF